MIGIPTVTLLWKSAETIQSRQEKICSVQILKKTKTHKRSLTCSNWSSILERFFHGDKTKGFGGWLGHASWRHYAFSCDEYQRAAVSAEELEGENNLTSFWSGSKKEGFSWRHHSWWYVSSIQLLNDDRCMSGDMTAILILRFSSFFFFLINNATNVHFGGWFATVEYQLWKISFKFFTGINFLTWFHVAVPFCLPFIGPSFLLPSHLSFIDSRWGAVACWALRLDERTIRIQRCIIDHTVRSSSFCAPALFLLFLYLISKTLFVCQVFFILLCNSLLFLSMDKWAK